jgi:hypothetical protein
MEWRWSLIGLVLLNSEVLAQEAPAPALLPAVPTVAPEDTGTTRYLFNEDSSPAGPGGRFAGNHAFPNFIGFVSNPLFAIDPRAVTAIYPIFGSYWVSHAAPIPDGDIQLYGPALTLALSERCAVGLCQGGYADAHFSRNQFAQLSALDPQGRFRDVESGGGRDGFLNLGGFFQYTLIENVAEQFLLTGGIRWEAPAGSYEVFQGHGPLHLAPYVTVGKEFGASHVLATTGYQFPAGPGDDTSELFYASLHLDRRVFGWLYPLVELNGTFVTRGVSFGLATRRGFIGFGNFEATGHIVTLAAGANAVLIPERLELGAVYSTEIASQRDFSVDGLLVKVMLRF